MQKFCLCAALANTNFKERSLFYVLKMYLSIDYQCFKIKMYKIYRFVKLKLIRVFPLLSAVVP